VHGGQRPPAGLGGGLLVLPPFADERHDFALTFGEQRGSLPHLTGDENDRQIDAGGCQSRVRSVQRRRFATTSSRS
jgi:hypothetical protein